MPQIVLAYEGRCKFLSAIFGGKKDDGGIPASDVAGVKALFRGMAGRKG